MNWLRLVPLLILAAPAFAAAQQTPQELTEIVIQEALDLYNRTGTVRLNGDSRVAAGSEIIGDLAVLDGVLEIAGRVRGHVLVLNGDLRLHGSAQIDGGVMVIGGSISGQDSARIDGGVRLYRAGFAYQLQEGVLTRVERVNTQELAAGREFGFGRTDVVVTARRGYNRAEGLPIVVGPRLTLGHANPTVVEALGIYRTGTGSRLNSDDLGFAIRAEQYFGGRRMLRVGARVFSEITPIELAGVSDRENSLATFVLHEDYRDHYERRGWTGYLSLDPVNEPWSLSVLYTDERQTSVRPREPFSLLDSGEDWRPEPLAAEGYLRAAALEAGYDSRNVPADPSHGWWLRASVERALGGSLITHFDTFAVPAPRRFWDGTVDLRRYARLGPSSRLAVRALITGSITGAALPVQRQHTLGGEGSLPGFYARRFDCGAQRQFVRRDNVTYQLYYGCDRAALVQLEYQTDFKFLRRLRNTAVDQLGLLQRVRAAVFFDAGRAWNEDDARNGLAAAATTTLPLTPASACGSDRSDCTGQCRSPAAANP